jgi:hypothetical protein
MEDQLITARIKALMVASYTMAFVIGSITLAMVAGLFVDSVDNEKVFSLLGYVMTSVISAVAGSYATLMGMKGELQAFELNTPAPEPEPEPVVSHPEQPTVVVSQEVSIVEDNDEDDHDDLEPWEKYRNDLRYDANGDGVVDESDFPDWRNPAR